MMTLHRMLLESSKLCRLQTYDSLPEFLEQRLSMHRQPVVRNVHRRWAENLIMLGYLLLFGQTFLPFSVVFTLEIVFLIDIKLGLIFFFCSMMKKLQSRSHWLQASYIF